jgi:hypothetical protein
MIIDYKWLNGEHKYNKFSIDLLLGRNLLYYLDYSFYYPSLSYDYVSSHPIEECWLLHIYRIMNEFIDKNKQNDYNEKISQYNIDIINFRKPIEIKLCDIKQGEIRIAESHPEIKEGIIYILIEQTEDMGYMKPLIITKAEMRMVKPYIKRDNKIYIKIITIENIKEITFSTSSKCNLIEIITKELNKVFGEGIYEDYKLFKENYGYDFTRRKTFKPFNIKNITKEVYNGKENIKN